MGNLTTNLEEIYSIKGQIKSAIGTKSNEFSYYPSYIEALKPSGYTYITENSDSGIDVSTYSYAYVNVPSVIESDDADLVSEILYGPPAYGWINPTTKRVFDSFPAAIDYTTLSTYGFKYNVDRTNITSYVYGNMWAIGYITADLGQNYTNSKNTIRMQISMNTSAGGTQDGPYLYLERRNGNGSATDYGGFKFSNNAVIDGSGYKLESSTLSGSTYYKIELNDAESYIFVSLNTSYSNTLENTTYIQAE